MHKEFSLVCLFIDMAARRTRRERLDPGVALTYLGGRGIGAYFLNTTPSLKACDANAPLIFAIGALTGSRIPSASRMMISAFSPLTNTACSCSVGGGLAWQMKKAGIDLIHITGHSERQLVVFVHDEHVSFEEAPCSQ
jgi:aldehyde:ferredoxin oxidoreductase